MRTGLAAALMMMGAACASGGVGNGLEVEDTAPAPATARFDPGTSIVDQCGDLSVSGRYIVCEDGEPVSLAGMSFFWSTTGWGQEKYYTAEVVDRLVSDWGADVVRVALAAGPGGGYLGDPEGNMERLDAVVNAAIEAGIYVIIDWHSHAAERNPEAAVKFFADVATKYGTYPNVIYEIYNEPLNTTDWASVIKPYSVNVIAVIRAIDPDNLILVGTQTWSQDVDKAAADPIAGYDDLAYVLHFYAGTHKEALRAKAQAALDAGFALFVSEWGTVNANGDGEVDYESTKAWMDFIRENRLSQLNWSVSDKEEGASIFLPGTPPEGPWPDETFTESGRYVRDLIRGWEN